MKPRKPDRFDQIAADNIEWHTPAGTPMISSYEVAKLLRKEHAAVVRMIKRLGVEYRTSDHGSDEHRSPAENLIIDILDQLKRMAR